MPMSDDIKKPSSEIVSSDPEEEALFDFELPFKQAPRTEPTRKFIVRMRGPVATFLFGVIVGMGLGVALVLKVVGT